MTLMKKIIPIVTALSLTCFLISCGGDTQSQVSTQTDSTKVAQENKQATNNDLLTFTMTDTKGVIRQSSEWIGKKPVVINVWGTWCPPCRAEIPAFVKAYEIYKDKGIEILGVAVRDTPDKVLTFAGQNNMHWEMMLFTDEALQKRFNIQSVPTTIFVDRTGKVMEIYNPRSKTMTESFSGAMHYEQFTGHLDSLLTL